MDLILSVQNDILTPLFCCCTVYITNNLHPTDNFQFMRGENTISVCKIKSLTCREYLNFGHEDSGIKWEKFTST